MEVGITLLSQYFRYANLIQNLSLNVGFDQLLFRLQFQQFSLDDSLKPNSISTTHPLISVKLVLT